MTSSTREAYEAEGSEQRDYGDESRAESIESKMGLLEAQMLGETMPNYGSLASADLTGLGALRPPAKSYEEDGYITEPRGTALASAAAAAAIDPEWQRRENNLQKRFIKESALDRAIASFGQNLHKRSPDEIIKRAERFYDFLKVD